MDIGKLRRTMGGGVVSDSGQTRINHPTENGKVWAEILGIDGSIIEVELGPPWDFNDVFDQETATLSGTRYTHSTEGETIGFEFEGGEFRETLG
jgi:hypothetical protein